MNHYYIGMEVVCMDDDFEGFKGRGVTVPKKGYIYTVRMFVDSAKGVGIYLNEIFNQTVIDKNGNEYEPGFLLTHFAKTADLSSGMLETLIEAKKILGIYETK